MRDGYLRGALSRPATQRQTDVLAAFVAGGGSVQVAAELVGIRPSTVKRHLADLRARSGLTTEQRRPPIGTMMLTKRAVTSPHLGRRAEPPQPKAYRLLERAPAARPST